MDDCASIVNRQSLDVPPMGAGPALARQLALQIELPLRERLRIVELFDALDAVRSRHYERVAIGNEPDLAAHVPAALLEPPEHWRPPVRLRRSRAAPVDERSRRSGPGE